MMLILRMKPLSVAVMEGEGGRESEQYNTEKVVTEITDGHQNTTLVVIGVLFF